VELEELTICCQREKEKASEISSKRKVILPGKKKPCCLFCAHENLNKYPRKN